MAFRIFLERIFAHLSKRAQFSGTNTLEQLLYRRTAMRTIVLLHRFSDTVVVGHEKNYDITHDVPPRQGESLDVED